MDSLFDESTLSLQELLALKRLSIWFLNEATKIIPDSDRNAAFHYATQESFKTIGVEMGERFSVAFADLRRSNPDRYRALYKHLGDSIHDKMEVAIKSLGSRPKTYKPGDATLKTYLQTIEALSQVVRNADGSIRSLDGSDLGKGQEFARRLLAVVRSARIFDFHPSDFATVYRATDLYTTTQVAKLSWQNPGDNSNPPTPKESKQFSSRIEEAGEKVPFPDPLPFDACYLGFGEGFPLTSDQWLSRGIGNERPTLGAALLGYVIWNTDGGWVVEIVQIVEPTDNYMLPNVVCQNGIWSLPVLNLAPWLTTHFVSAINDHRKLILETKPTSGQRHTWGKKGKQLKIPTLTPKPYYIVRLEKSLIEDSGERNRKRLSQIARELSYRHDRRRHERCYIRRGKLPIDEVEALKLAEAQYKIWTTTEPDSNAYRQLMERNQPPKAADEWMAILTCEIDQTVVGPENKPYIPAIRIPAER